MAQSSKFSKLCILVFTEEAKDQIILQLSFSLVLYLFSLLQMVSLQIKRHYFNKDDFGQFYSAFKGISKEMFPLVSPSLLVTVPGELL